MGLGLPNVCWSWMRASSELGSPGPQEGQEHCSGQAGARMHEVAPSSEGRQRVCEQLELCAWPQAIHSENKNETK